MSMYPLNRPLFARLGSDASVLCRLEWTQWKRRSLPSQHASRAKVL